MFGTLIYNKIIIIVKDVEIKAEDVEKSKEEEENLLNINNKSSAISEQIV